MLYRPFAVLFVFALIATMAEADHRLDLLEKIKDSNTLVFGYRQSAMPSSYRSAGSEPADYSHDLQMKIAEAIQQTLELPDLTVRHVLTSPRTRVQQVRDGQIDLECGTRWSEVRDDDHVLLSTPILQADTRLLIKKTSAIKSFDDLRGKTVAATANTTSEMWLQVMNAQDNYSMTILTAPEDESFLLLESGRVDALMLDGVSLHQQKSKLRDPSEWIQAGIPQTREIYGCLLPNDPAFKQVVDQALSGLFASGDLHRIYDKWFPSPISPDGVNLIVPVEETMERLTAPTLIDVSDGISQPDDE